MVLYGPHPLESDKSYDEYRQNVAALLRRIRLWVSNLEEANSSDNGLMALVFVLRLLVAAGPKVSFLIAKGEVDAWQDAHLAWIDRVKRQFPSDTQGDNLKARDLEAFSRLRQLVVNVPKRFWEEDVKGTLESAQGRYRVEYQDYGAEYAMLLQMVRKSVRLWASKLGKSRGTDVGFMGAVFALRVVAEAAPEVSKRHVASGETDEWENAYTRWFKRVKNRFPSKVDSDELKAHALEEFARLRSVAGEMPATEWQQDRKRDLETDSLW